MKNETSHAAFNPGASREGFTLLELLVVVAIIGILAVAAVPQVFNAICDSRVTARKSDINTVLTAIQQCKMGGSDGSSNDCMNLGSHYQPYLPERIWDSDDWELSDSDQDGRVNTITVQNIGCSWTDSEGSEGNAMFYDVEKGTYTATSGG